MRGTKKNEKSKKINDISARKQEGKERKPKY